MGNGLIKASVSILFLSLQGDQPPLPPPHFVRGIYYLLVTLCGIWEGIVHCLLVFGSDRFFPFCGVFLFGVVELSRLKVSSFSTQNEKFESGNNIKMQGDKVLGRPIIGEVGDCGIFT